MKAPSARAGGGHGGEAWAPQRAPVWPAVLAAAGTRASSRGSSPPRWPSTREAGWSGFSFDAVARRAGVGKAPLYLRWASKEDLLLAAFGAHTTAITITDSGNLRDDLTEYTCRLIDSKARAGRVGVPAAAPGSHGDPGAARQLLQPDRQPAR